MSAILTGIPQLGRSAADGAGVTTSVDRARPFYLAASAAVLLATSFGAGRVLTVQNASAPRFEENPVAGVTVEPSPPATGAPVALAPPTTGAAAQPATLRSGAAPTTTTNPVTPVCQWAVHMVAGGIEGFGEFGDADQFVVSVLNPAWAGKTVYYHLSYAVPAVARPVLVSLPQQAVADETGQATFVLPIGPESQGGAIALLASPKQRIADALASNDVCDWNEFAVDYNGPTGLVGGIASSLAKDVSGLLGRLTD